MKADLSNGIRCALIAVLLSAVPVSALSFQETCADSKITVVAEKIKECESVCSAIQNGLALLRSIGFDFSVSLTVTVLKKMPVNGHESAIGQYDSRSNEIMILDYDTVVSGATGASPAYGMPMNPEIWRSYVVHELAHAAVHSKFVPGVPVCTASEYISSVVSLATLPPGVREKIVQNYPGISGFENPGEITFGYYLLDPSKFSVNSYLHFSRTENGVAFIKKLLREGLPDD